MKRELKWIPRGVTLLIVTAALAGCASDMTDVISTDVAAFRRVESSKGAIPHDILRRAKAVAIFSSTQAGLIFGGKGGEGVFLKRLDDGWSPPLAIDLVEGSVGLQIGAQSEDIVYVFTTDDSVTQFLTEGRYAIAQMAGTFGEAAGRNDGTARPTDPVTIYTRTSGVYGGLVVGGKGFAIDEKLNRATYGSNVTTEQIVSGKVDAPHGSMVLWKLLDTQDEVQQQATAENK